MAIAGLAATGSERISIMMRLRNGLLAVVLGTGMIGCSSSHFNIAHWSIYHCDECDDFPMPAYGPDFSMAPGTYTNVGGRSAVDTSRPANAAPAGELLPADQPSTAMPPATSTPPVPPAAGPGPGAAADQPASPGMTSSPAIATTDAGLPQLPPDAGDLVVPRANRPGETTVR
jgi:hypothetical protein